MGRSRRPKGVSRRVRHTVLQDTVGSSRGYGGGVREAVSVVLGQKELVAQRESVQERVRQTLEGASQVLTYSCTYEELTPWGKP